jgi:hypothetical protein
MSQRRHNVGVDLDGTLAKYYGWKGIDHIEDPIPGAVEFCNRLAKKYDVIIHTARCNLFADGRPEGCTPELLKSKVKAWLDKHGFHYKDIYTGVGKLIASAYVDDRAVSCRPLDIPNIDLSATTDNPVAFWAKSEYDAAEEEIDRLCNYTATKEVDLVVPSKPNNEKYDECPFYKTGFKMVSFDILPSTIIGPDGRCICTKDKACLNVDKRSGERCTEAELDRLDREAVSRRNYQSGYYDDEVSGD